MAETNGTRRSGEVAGILLAAGESRRMGETNKLALTIGGESILRRSARQLLGSRLGEIVVVLGHQPEIARGLLSGLPLTLTENPHYREGQMTSVHWGLAQLRQPAQGIMICLSDQPLLTNGDIDTLIDAYLNQCDKPVLVPTHGGQRGNPVVLSHAQRESILAGNRNLGCRRFIDNNPDLVRAWPVDNDHFTRDLDTPEEYRCLIGADGTAAVAAEA